MLPILNPTQTNSKKYIVNFQGLNLGEGYSDGEFSACENISSALSPCITQRWGRTREAEHSAPSALHAKDGLIIIDGTKVLHKGKTVGTVSAGVKQMANVGNYVIIFPDKKYYNVDTGEFGSMDLTQTAAAGTVTFTDGSISLNSGSFSFRAGDAITISGCTTLAENNKSVIIRSVVGGTIQVYENTFTAGDEAAAVTFRREIPDMDVICESNYRLWGAKGHTIYGSKYGDPLNFNVFDGLTGDSYYIDAGSDGEFTGAIAYSSHICFFKEHTLHKLYGSKPSNFQLTTSQVHGVQAGSERSMCIINETLFYKGVNGVYAYTGGVPELVSGKFGTVRFSDACAVSDGERYYISMQTGGEWHLMVYDVLRNIWLREDDTHCVDMAFSDGYVYLLTTDGLWKIDPEADRSKMEWSITLCPFTETINERKGYSKFHIRMELAAGAWLTVEAKRDRAAQWQRVYTTHNARARTFTVPILPERCDCVEIRLRGKGECLLRTFVREFMVGSDV